MWIQLGIFKGANQPPVVNSNVEALVGLDLIRDDLLSIINHGNHEVENLRLELADFSQKLFVAAESKGGVGGHELCLFVELSIAWEWEASWV